MTMWNLILLLLVSGTAALIVVLTLRTAKASLRRPATWLLVAGGPICLSLLSALATAERSSGTGTLVSRGWPKPYLFRWTSWEGPQVSDGANILFFLGNCAFYASISLLIWAAWQLAAPGRRRP